MKKKKRNKNENIQKKKTTHPRHAHTKVNECRKRIKKHMKDKR